MDASQIAESLAQWKTSLDARATWQNPGAQYRYLVRYADKLAACNAIDPLERFDMVEMALAAFCHFVEEKPEEWRHPASEYDVYNDAGAQVGSLQGSRYFLHGATVRPDPKGFFAQIQEKDGESLLTTRTYAPYGVLRDRYIHTHTGQRLTLVETARMINGKWRVRIDDPDTYRGVVDASQVALEQGNTAAYVDLWEKEHFSIFTQCSRCCDRFDLREDCTGCEGRGFIEDLQCPSRLPSSAIARKSQAPDLQVPKNHEPAPY
ncbi:hypothetical protein PSE10A_55300 [Pseudomonas amygdali pv. eriobotryae]|uniref:Uncharacterized protein n=1 Tax=Pseudomonas amygdali pv. eriobotryae TaxID=129137 RepID=A0A9P3EFG8_PSEA0|nr:hypothetical protein [Pseudomonas amygdali]GFZ63019.1 hypothetical protein PSE10A_55300 [Pseudomonas amygdali pv. eriobotryae]